MSGKTKHQLPRDSFLPISVYFDVNGRPHSIYNVKDDERVDLYCRTCGDHFKSATGRELRLGVEGVNHKQNHKGV